MWVPIYFNACCVSLGDTFYKVPAGYCSRMLCLAVEVLCNSETNPYGEYLQQVL